MSQRSPGLIVAGIDEAGYGPLVGPLVVASCAYELEKGASEQQLHRLVDDRTARKEGLPTADSKRLYHGAGGRPRSLATLELSACGHVVLARGVLPVTVAGLLHGALDLERVELEQLPWYGTRLLGAELPRQSPAEQVLERAAAHGERLLRQGARVVDLCVAPVPVPRFNRLTRAAGTKAFTLFRSTGRLIEHLVGSHPEHELVIHVDRQGGRIHYGDLLQTFFPLAPLVTLHERPAESSYRLDFPGRAPVAIHFRVQADGSRAPVAVASVLAKTVRELFMARLNSWFIERRPELAPTAGYGTDGQRFVREVSDMLATARIPAEQLVRCR